MWKLRTGEVRLVVCESWLELEAVASEKESLIPLRSNLDWLRSGFSSTQYSIVDNLPKVHPSAHRNSVGAYWRAVHFMSLNSVELMIPPDHVR